MNILVESLAPLSLTVLVSFGSTFNYLLFSRIGSVVITFQLKQSPAGDSDNCYKRDRGGTRSAKGLGIFIINFK